MSGRGGIRTSPEKNRLRRYPEKFGGRRIGKEGREVSKTGRERKNVYPQGPPEKREKRGKCDEKEEA